MKGFDLTSPRNSRLKDEHQAQQPEDTIGGRASCVAAARAGSLELAEKYAVAVPRSGAFRHIQTPKLA
jgi:hypothetical protein